MDHVILGEQSEEDMSTCLDPKILEELMFGDNGADEGDHGHTIFYSGNSNKKQLEGEFLIELLLIYDCGILDIETLAKLFDVSCQDILLFTDNCPAYGNSWKESVGTMWTKCFRFYEEDLPDLAWMAKYAIKRAELAIQMETTLMNATKEMGEELDEDEGWTEENEFLRWEGQVDRTKRLAIIDSWWYRMEMEVEENGDYTST